MTRPYAEFVLSTRAAAQRQLDHVQAVALGSGTLDGAAVTLAQLRSIADGEG